MERPTKKSFLVKRDDDSSKSTTKIIVGAGIGSVVFFVLLLFLTVWLLSQKRKKSRVQTTEELEPDYKPSFTGTKGAEPPASDVQNFVVPVFRSRHVVYDFDETEIHNNEGQSNTSSTRGFGPESNPLASSKSLSLPREAHGAAVHGRSTPSQAGPPIGFNIQSTEVPLSAISQGFDDRIFGIEYAPAPSLPAETYKETTQDNISPLLDRRQSNLIANRHFSEVSNVEDEEEIGRRLDHPTVSNLALDLYSAGEPHKGSETCESLRQPRDDARPCSGRPPSLNGDEELNVPQDSPSRAVCYGPVINPYEVEFAPNPVIHAHLRKAFNAQSETVVEDFHPEIENSQVSFFPGAADQDMKNYLAIPSPKVIDNLLVPNVSSPSSIITEAPTIFSERRPSNAYSYSSPSTIVDDSGLQCMDVDSLVAEHTHHYTNPQSSSHSPRKSRKRYSCHLCPSEFTRSNDVKRHKQQIHGINSPSARYECTHCRIKIGRKDNYERHVRKCSERARGSSDG